MRRPSGRLTRGCGMAWARARGVAQSAWALTVSVGLAWRVHGRGCWRLCWSRGLDSLVDQPAVATAADGGQLALELAQLALQLAQRLCHLGIHRPSLAIRTVRLWVRGSGTGCFTRRAKPAGHEPTRHDVGRRVRQRGETLRRAPRRRARRLRWGCVRRARPSLPAPRPSPWPCPPSPTRSRRRVPSACRPAR